VLAYRSRRIPVIRMNALFGVPEAGVPSMARVLLTIGERVALGLLVDEVLGLTAVDPSRIAPLPGLATLLDPRFFRGLFSRQNRVVLVVSEAGLAGLDEVSRFCEENP
jgi:chemotaxis signal transduction protein